MILNASVSTARRGSSARLTLSALLTSLIALSAVPAQTVAPATLSLGDAVRLAAKQSAAVVAARYRAEQADARVTQQRADLLPNVSASALENGRTLNTATFGIDFRLWEGLITGFAGLAGRFDIGGSR